MNGPNLVLWWLVTPQGTLPVAFAFYLPDPALMAWKKADEPLKRPGLPPNNRPRNPTRAPAYPTKQGIARAKKARNEGSGGKPMKLVVVTQWVRARYAGLKSHPTKA